MEEAQFEKTTDNEHINEDLENDIPEITDDTDIELQIPCFTTKRSQLGAPIHKKTILYEQNIPLLIKHIQQIQTGNEFSDIKSIFGINFKTIMIYGRAVLAGVRSKNNSRLYTIDDGTGSVIVNFAHTGDQRKYKILCEVSKMSWELDVAKRCGLPILTEKGIKHKSDAGKDIIKSMDMIMNKIKKNTYLPETSFQHGVKISVVGIPYKMHKTGEVRLYATEMIEDKEQSRDKEIFFKRDLIRFYKNRILNSNNFN